MTSGARLLLLSHDVISSGKSLPLTLPASGGGGGKCNALCLRVEKTLFIIILVILYRCAAGGAH